MMETSQCKHTEVNAQSGHEDEILIYDLQGERASTHGPKHSGSFWSGTRSYGKSQTSWAHLLLPVPALAQYPGRATPPR